MTKKRSHGEGTIDTRRENIHRLRYRVNGRRFSKEFHGSLSDARKEQRRLIQSGDSGQHIPPQKLTVSHWVNEWLALKEAKRRRKTVLRYRELLEKYVVTRLGARPLQQLEPREINSLYVQLERLAPRTRHHIHVVFKGCLQAAVKNKLLSSNPAASADPPSAGDQEAGRVLDEDELAAVVNGSEDRPFTRSFALRPSPECGVAKCSAYVGRISMSVIKHLE